MIRPVTIIVLLLLTIGCDQVSKKIVRRHIHYDETILIVDHNLTLTRVENTGSFLGLGNSLKNPYRFVLLTVFPLLFLVGATIWLFRKKDLSKLNVLGFILVIGGGFGNLYDRAIYGSVTDFLHIRIGAVQTGVFNVADMAIMSGIFILIIHSYIRQSRMHKTNS